MTPAEDELLAVAALRYALVDEVVDRGYAFLNI